MASSRWTIMAFGVSLLIILSSGTLRAQQVYSHGQYLSNITPVNPVYSLTDAAGNLSLSGRKQFLGINGAPTSLLFTGSLPVNSINGAAGIVLMHNEIAVEKQFKLNAFFAKAIHLTGETLLGVSLNAGLHAYNANYSVLDPTDPQFKDDIRETSPNIGFGIMLYSYNYYVGLSVPEISLRSLGTATTGAPAYLNKNIYFTGAYIADLNNGIKFKPSVLVAYAKNQTLLTDFTGTLYFMETVGVGAGYRSNKTAAGSLSVITENLKIGYTYQFGVSSQNLGGFNNAVHEVGLGYRFGDTTNKRLL